MKLEPREVRGVMSPGDDVQRGRAGDRASKGDGILILSPDAPAGAELARHVGSARRGAGGQRHPQPPRRALARRHRARGGGAVRRAAGDPRAGRGARGAAAQSGAASRRRESPTIRAPVPATRPASSPASRVGPSPLAHAGAPGGVRDPRRSRTWSTSPTTSCWSSGTRCTRSTSTRSAGGIPVRRAPAGRAHDDAGRRRTPAGGGGHRHRRRARGRGAGGRHGRRRQRGVGGHPPRCCWRRPRSIPSASAARRSAWDCSSEASYRFERGVDAEGVPAGRRRGPPMLARLGGGAVLDGGVRSLPPAGGPRTARLPVARLQRLAGLPISAEAGRGGAAQDLADQVKVRGHGERRRRWRCRSPASAPTSRCPKTWSRRSCGWAAATNAAPQIERVLANARSVPSPETPGRPRPRSAGRRSACRRS